MQPEQLYNQLRFNLEHPYSINQLSVRHKKPQPITFEKAGLAGEFLSNTRQDPERAEKELNAKFSNLSIDRLKEAQFLAQRQIKKQKDDLLVGGAQRSDGKPLASKVSRDRLVNKQPLKVIPTKKLQHLPVAGDSPPVRDVSTCRNKPKRNGSTFVRRNLSKQMTSQRKPGTAGAQIVRKEATSNGVLQERLGPGDNVFNMPDLHRLAMDQLLHVQSGDISPRKGTIAKPSLQKANNTPDDHRPKSATPKKIKFMTPSARADVARALRARAYKQPLFQPRPKPKMRTPNPKARKGRVLQRHECAPQYDPDYDYRINAADHLNNIRHRYMTTPVQKSQPLPDPDDFIQRIVEARRVNESMERCVADPRKIVAEIEKEAREQLEPLVQQAQRLSDKLRSAVATSNPRNLYTVTPQYNGGHEGQEMSADDLLHHPLQSPIGGSKQSNSPGDYNLHPGTSYGNAHIHNPFLGLQHAGAQAMPEIDGDAHAASPTAMNHLEEGSTAHLTSNDFFQLQSMLERLDEMQKEHVDMRNRWLTVSTQYADQGLIALEPDDAPESEGTATGETVVMAPRPILLKKAQSLGAQSRPALVERDATLQDVPAPHPLARPTYKDTGYREVTLSLPEKKIKSTQEGKNRFKKHLEGISHTPSAGFNPWTFAEQTADDIVNDCLAQVTEEFLEAGDDLIQGLYADEFISVKCSPTNRTTVPPT